MALANGQSATVAGVRVESIAAYDLTPGAPEHPKGEASGYTSSRWAGGASSLPASRSACPEVLALKDIDVAFMPMNIPPRRMMPAAAADCVKRLKPKVVYVYHYDKGAVAHHQHEAVRRVAAPGTVADSLQAFRGHWQGRASRCACPIGMPFPRSSGRFPGPDRPANRISRHARRNSRRVTAMGAPYTSSRRADVSASAGVPSNATRPRDSSTTRRFSGITSSTWCVTMRIVVPSRASRRTVSGAGGGDEVEPAVRRLVQHQQLGPGDQRPRDQHATALARGHLVKGLSARWVASTRSSAARPCARISGVTSWWENTPWLPSSPEVAASSPGHAAAPAAHAKAGRGRR